MQGSLVEVPPILSLFQDTIFHHTYEIDQEQAHLLFRDHIIHRTDFYIPHRSLYIFDKCADGREQVGGNAFPDRIYELHLQNGVHDWDP
jgi:hypothetical protein